MTPSPEARAPVVVVPAAEVFEASVVAMVGEFEGLDILGPLSECFRCGCAVDVVTPEGNENCCENVVLVAFG